MEQSLDSIISVECHSHNDYWRPYPLFSALSAGCTGIEADVFLGNDGDLLVGHGRKSLQKDKTLRSMYLDPLYEMLHYRNVGRENDERLGIFRASHNTQIVLMIDVKEEPEVIWPKVLQELEQFRQNQFLTRYDLKMGTGLSWGPLIIVGSGALDLDTMLRAHQNTNTSSHEYRDTFLDAPTLHLDGKRYNDSNSYYTSASFNAAIGSVSLGFSNKQVQNLRAQV